MTIFEQASMFNEQYQATSKVFDKCDLFIEASMSEYNIALKEAAETDYWLDVIHVADYLNDEEYSSLKKDNDELLRLLASIVKKTKSTDSQP